MNIKIMYLGSVVLAGLFLLINLIIKSQEGLLFFGFYGVISAILYVGEIIQEVQVE